MKAKARFYGMNAHIAAAKASRQISTGLSVDEAATEPAFGERTTKCARAGGRIFLSLRKQVQFCQFAENTSFNGPLH